MPETRITLTLRDDNTVGTDIEAAAGAEPLTVLNRAIDALQAERKALPNCPVHRGPTFRQEVEALARIAQRHGDRKSRMVSYGLMGDPLREPFRSSQRIRADFWLAAASSLRVLVGKAREMERHEQEWDERSKRLQAARRPILSTDAAAAQRLPREGADDRPTAARSTEGGGTDA